MSGPNSIGTRKESSLHANLKTLYAGHNGLLEQSSGVYICDAVCENGLVIEVQTGSFAPLKEKLAYLCACGPVLLVHPIIAERWIEVFSESGTLIRRRKSPSKHSDWQLFAALIHAPLLPKLKNLSIELAYVSVTEKRIEDGKGSWRRKGVSIIDKQLNNLIDSKRLVGSSGIRSLLPFSAEENFTSSELAKKAKCRIGLARKALYVYKKLGILEEQGRKGREKLYLVTKP